MDNTSKEYNYSLTSEDKGTAGRTLRLVGTGKRVLELGCSVGVQSRVLVEELGCTVVGVEIHAAAAEKARRYCERVIVGNLETLDLAQELAGERFDVILCSDVLEHLRAPAKTLSSLKPLMAHGATIVSSIPNVAFAGLVFELVKGRFKYRETGLLDATHIKFFTRENLFEMFSEAGFVVEQLDRATGWPEGTEFKTRLDTVQERMAMDAIIAMNEESLTYHFIVRARPAAASECGAADMNMAFETANVAAHIPAHEGRIAANLRRLSLRSTVEGAIRPLHHLRSGRLVNAVIRKLTR